MLSFEFPPSRGEQAYSTLGTQHRTHFNPVLKHPLLRAIAHALGKNAGQVTALASFFLIDQRARGSAWEKGGGGEGRGKTERDNPYPILKSIATDRAAMGASTRCCGDPSFTQSRSHEIESGSRRLGALLGANGSDRCSRWLEPRADRSAATASHALQRRRCGLSALGRGWRMPREPRLHASCVCWLV